MHTTPSGKKYVGISKNNAVKRWDCGRGYQGNTHFFNAIMKYGWINIKHEFYIKICLNKKPKKKKLN